MGLTKEQLAALLPTPAQLVGGYGVPLEYAMALWRPLLHALLPAYGNEEGEEGEVPEGGEGAGSVSGEGAGGGGVCCKCVSVCGGRGEAGDVQGQSVSLPPPQSRHTPSLCLHHRTSRT
jgi:hypothetical protein